MRPGCRLAAALIAVVLASSCGGSEPSAPTQPSPRPSTEVPADIVNMNGTWVGTLETSAPGVQQITMTVVQFVNCVDGTWRSDSSDYRGALSGYAAKDSYTGLFSFEYGSCLGIVQITGNVEANTLRLTGGPVTKSVASGTCIDPLPESVVLSLRRQ